MCVLHVCLGLRRPEESVGSSGAEVPGTVGVCKLSTWMLGTEFGSSGRAVDVLTWWIAPVPHQLFTDSFALWTEHLSVCFVYGSRLILWATCHFISNQVIGLRPQESVCPTWAFLTFLLSLSTSVPPFEPLSGSSVLCSAPPPFSRSLPCLHEPLSS